jgi:transposase
VGKKTGPNPTDRAKVGTKRSVWVDGRGAPIGIYLAAANCNDSELFELTYQSIVVQRPKVRKYRPQHLCLDKGYDSKVIRYYCQKWHYRTHIVSRNKEAKAIKHKKGYKARRWVVERTHSWLNRYRAILIRWNKKAENYLALLHLACALTVFKLIDIR